MEGEFVKNKQTNKQTKVSVYTMFFWDLTPRPTDVGRVCTTSSQHFKIRA